MNRSQLDVILLVFPLAVGCTSEPEHNCNADVDCCFKPNPAYFCNDGVCTYNPFVASDYVVYNYRVQQCYATPGTGGAGPGPNCDPDLPINPSGVALAVPELPQQCQSWCWAASIAMVANYYGTSISECALAGYKTGYGSSCCAWAACSSPCDQSALGPEIASILSQLGFYGTYLTRALTESELQLEISSGRPVCVMFQGSFSGHAVVVTAFTGTSPTLYHVVDPWYGPQDIPYANLVWGPNGEHWMYSISRISPYSDGCSPVFNPGFGACH
jgi:hypothetical protein